MKTFFADALKTCLLAPLALLVIYGQATERSLAQIDIKVTEIMYNPTTEGAWEWIEVRNDGASAVDLNGYLGFNLGDADLSSPNPTIDSTLDADTVIQPGEIAVIYDGFFSTGDPNNFNDQPFRDAWGLGNGVKLIGASFFPGMNNTPGNQGQSIGFWPNADAWRLDQSPVEDDPENEPGVFTNRTTSFTNAAFSIDFSAAEFPTVDGSSSITWTGNGDITAGGNWLQSVSGSNGAVTSVLVEDPGGAINNPNDVGNPGLVPGGSPTTSGLIFSEILYDTAGDEPDWEWIEVYNGTASAIDISGYVVDDVNNSTVSAANIASGSVPAGGTAILFNADDVDQADFAAAWGASLNLVPVTEWGQLGLNNSGDQISLWDSFANYTGDHQNHANAVTTQSFLEAEGFPTGSQGPSIFLADLSLDATDGANWVNAATEDFAGSFNAMEVSGSIEIHPGGDNGSPGTFDATTISAGDFNGDGNVDGEDFLLWQQGGSPNPLSAGDLADWQTNYGAAAVAAVSAVPEPSSLLLLVLGLTSLAARRR